MSILAHHWLIFFSLLLPLLFIDLRMQRNHSSQKDALYWSIIWIATGLLFAGYVNYTLGSEARDQYLAAYLIEKSLSVDNLFVFLLIFSSMRIPHQFQRRALSWGIFGALVFRALFVVAGIAALERWEWVKYIFAGFLFYAAFKSLQKKDEDAAAEESKITTWLCAHLPISRERDTNHFLINEDNRWKVTPLFLSILALECSDIVFAVDSVPAALSISRDQFIVYSSNAFAILGLRALYILLAGAICRLRYLHYGLAGVLLFAGLKMIAPEGWEIAPLHSVIIILAMITMSALPTLLENRSLAKEHIKEKGV